VKIEVKHILTHISDCVGKVTQILNQERNQEKPKRKKIKGPNSLSVKKSIGKAGALKPTRKRQVCVWAWVLVWVVVWVCV